MYLLGETPPVGKQRLILCASSSQLKTHVTNVKKPHEQHLSKISDSGLLVFKCYNMKKRVAATKDEKMPKDETGMKGIRAGFRIDETCKKKKRVRAGQEMWNWWEGAERLIRGEAKPERRFESRRANRSGEGEHGITNKPKINNDGKEGKQKRRQTREHTRKQD